MTPASSGLLVQRDDLHKTRWVSDDTIARAPLPDGAVRFRIDSFALTSNNVTYAAFGDAMNYWRFFPADDAAWGRIPVWGFANVVESRCEGVDPGERFYGYWPLATHAVLQPERVTTAGLVDGAEHRRDLHAVYNQYLRCSADPGYDVAREAEQALLRPLYVTSFLIDDFLADNAFFGARRVLLSSASSKTAYGTAFCLSRRRGTTSEVQVIGLTSPGNLAFTQGLGCYDRVLTHGDVTRLAADEPAVYVDFSGSAAVRESVHTPLRRQPGVQLLRRRHPLGRARQRQGAARSAPGAVLRAGADQQARRRLGIDRAAGTPGAGLARLHAAGHRPEAPLAAGGARAGAGCRGSGLCGAARRPRTAPGRARADPVARCRPPGSATLPGQLRDLKPNT